MSERTPSIQRLSGDILSENPDLTVPLQDVISVVEQFRNCGLSDVAVKRATVNRLRKLVDETGSDESRTPEPNEILVFALPDEYVGTRFLDWR